MVASLLSAVPPSWSVPLLLTATPTPGSGTDGSSPVPAPTPTPTSNAVKTVVEVAEVTVDALTLAWHLLVGALIGLVVGILVLIVARRMGRRQPMWLSFSHHCHLPLYATGATSGAYIAAQVWIAGLEAEVATPKWASMVTHSLLLAVVASFAWLGTGIVRVVEDTTVSHARENSDQGRARRVTTQAQILRRVAEVIIVICGIVGAVMTFPAARVAMGSLLASAGLISVIAGLAAQSMLGNVFAGIQLAMTDAIRVDDIVVVDGENGNIEEITLTYVVVHIWDDRRLILPSKYFTEHPFANWSRRGNQVTGSLTMSLDWRVPVSALRSQLHQVLAATPGWDGREASLDVIDTSTQYVTVRVAVSGPNPGAVASLKNHVREELVAWLQTEAAYALPRTRVEVDTVQVSADPTPEKVARLAEELAHLSSPGGGGPVPQILPEPEDAAAPASEDPIEAARVRASSWRASLARKQRRDAKRRRSAFQRLIRPGAEEDGPDDVLQETEVMSGAESKALLEQARTREMPAVTASPTDAVAHGTARPASPGDSVSPADAGTSPYDAQPTTGQDADQQGARPQETQDATSPQAAASRGEDDTIITTPVPADPSAATPPAAAHPGGTTQPRRGAEEPRRTSILPRGDGRPARRWGAGRDPES